MIVVCGIRADAMIELMCARLEDLGYEYVFFDQAQVPDRYGVSWSLGPDGVEGRFMTPGRIVDLQDLTGVYIRNAGYRGQVGEPVRDDPAKSGKALFEAAYQQAVGQLVDLLPCTVVNRALASASSDSKVYQASVAAAFGFGTPRTLVSTEPDAVREFYAACSGRVIYKSLSSVRSIVHRLEPRDLGEWLERVRNCPAQFQEQITGVDVRVHTVGGEVFAIEALSDADDYRYARREGSLVRMREAAVPREIGDACVAMSRHLGLEVAGIDLRRTDDGYCFFEVNPSPGFLFYERATGQPISKAVADLLRAPMYAGPPAPREAPA
jgi:glutathione synthase/RimK-type ligase-like ATP-grasp enzyme